MSGSTRRRGHQRTATREHIVVWSTATINADNEAIEVLVVMSLVALPAISQRQASATGETTSREERSTREARQNKESRGVLGESPLPSAAVSRYRLGSCWITNAEPESL